MKLLSDKKFGKSKTEKNANGPDTKLFVRCHIPEISLSNTSFMQENGVNLEKFRDIMNYLKMKLDTVLVIKL